MIAESFGARVEVTRHAITRAYQRYALADFRCEDWIKDQALHPTRLMLATHHDQLYRLLTPETGLVVAQEAQDGRPVLVVLTVLNAFLGQYRYQAQRAEQLLWYRAAIYAVDGREVPHFCRGMFQMHPPCDPPRGQLLRYELQTGQPYTGRCHECQSAYNLWRRRQLSKCAAARKRFKLPLSA